ncbi:MAG: tetratricopeptide repeat protein [Bacteroidota bacterium]
MLKTFIMEDPSDPFNHYALALEYLNAGDFDDARTLFQYVFENHPTYLANYYQFGKLEESLGNNEMASKLYSIGIGVARNTGDQKTASELQSALDFME